MPSGIFISYSHDDRDISEAIQNLLSIVLPSIEIIVDTDQEGRPGQEYGRPWLESITKNLVSSDMVIQILSTSAATSPYVCYEAGVIDHVRMAQPKVLVFPVLAFTEANTLPAFFSRDQALSFSGGTPVATPEAIKHWLSRIADGTKGGSEQVRHLLRASEDRPVKAFLKTIESARLRRQSGSKHCTWIAARTQRRLRRLRKSPVKNDLLERLLARWLTSVDERLERSKSLQTLDLPKDSYPNHLIALVGNDEVDARAIAIVDDVEHFWNRASGEDVREASAIGNSRRIFVFKRREELSDYMPVLARHADSYETRVLSADQMYELVGFVDDFSILSDRSVPPDELVAFYPRSQGQSVIRFSHVAVEIQRYTNWFDRLWEESRVFSPADRGGFVDRVFSGAALEMSRYIDIAEYDRCEKEHPFYTEMLETMLRQFRKLVPRRRGSPAKVLEMGSGTGHLTERLIKLMPEFVSRIVTVELDEELYKFLLGKVPKDAAVNAYNRDACSFDPPGKFDAVVSSFSDHHIMSNEKRANEYLANVCRNMHSNSVFIVGDEFLPWHEDDAESRRDAIQRYHESILQIVKARREEADDTLASVLDGLLALETEALNSGLAAVEDPETALGGDYKVPLQTYLERLERAGLIPGEPILIGPDRATAERNGGIWVVVARLEDAESTLPD